jgi:transcriptional regulator with XRE-family HTH domain
MTALAKRAGLSRAMISFVERDLRTPSLETLLRMTYALELDLGEVIHKAAAAAKATARTARQEDGG